MPPARLAGAAVRPCLIHGGGCRSRRRVGRRGLPRGARSARGKMALSIESSSWGAFQLGWLTRGRPARSARVGQPPRALALRPRSGPCGRRAPVDGPSVIAGMWLRRLSNSVPSPLSSALVRPSSSRPRAVFARIRSRLRNGGQCAFSALPLQGGDGADAWRWGLMRDLWKICQSLSRAMPRSAGARAVDRVRFAVCWVGASSAPGGRR